jgi:hypothetical protein
MISAISIEVMDVFNSLLQPAIMEAESSGRCDLALGLAQIKFEVNRRFAGLLAAHESETVRCLMDMCARPEHDSWLYGL